MIAVKNLTFGYKSAQSVLVDLQLNISPGRIYGLLGRNGSGKTSLLHIISGLLFPDGGECLVSGEVPGNRNPRFLQQIYLLPEEIHVPNVSIKNYLNVYAAFYPNFSDNLFLNALKDFEIHIDNKFNALSYGEKKKVMISFAIATQAKVLLLDEPTNGLDIPSKKQFRKVIAGTLLNEQIIVMSTHQVKDLDRLIDQVLVLDERRIVLNEPVERIAEKLVFKQVMSLNEAENVVYSEGGLKGHAVVALNTGNEESKIDMEMFFNAVLHQKDLIQSHFKN
jgi:ABC-2 type transport system ATP-binding protein